MDEIAYQWTIMAPALRVAKQAGGALGLHEYSAPTMQSDAGWLCLRYRKVYDVLPPDLQDIPLIIGECGIDGGVVGAGSADTAGWKHYASAQQYADQLEWYDREMSRDAYVLGATIFTAGSTGMWDDFEVKDCPEVLDMIAQQFILPAHFGKNFDALYDCMTDPVHKSGPQPGFVVVLEQIPAHVKFDKEAREQLLDIFRDTADYWSDRKVPFRCFYSFL